MGPIGDRRCGTEDVLDEVEGCKHPSCILYCRLFDSSAAGFFEVSTHLRSSELDLSLKHGW